MEQIDFVVAWVDGNDPVWINDKNKSSQKNCFDCYDSKSINRFRDWNLLKYWFRSVEKFAPWVNKIYFVTYGHLPDFLNLDNPKLVIVNHKDYIPKDYLPTFSANCIELNFHRISGLSEKFVYFNDDHFLLREIKPVNFFKNGIPCICAPETVLTPISNETWQYIILNDMICLNKNFSKKSTNLISFKYNLIDFIRGIFLKILFPKNILCFKNVHGPAPFLKSTYDEVWFKEYDLLNSTCMHRFRNTLDVNQWLLLWWQVLKKKYNPVQIDNIVLPITVENIPTIQKIIINQSHDMICINDECNIDDFEKFSIKLQKSFEIIFPEKSSFEK